MVKHATADNYTVQHYSALPCTCIALHRTTALYLSTDPGWHHSVIVCATKAAMPSTNWNKAKLSESLDWVQLVNEGPCKSRQGASGQRNRNPEKSTEVWRVSRAARARSSAVVAAPSTPPTGLVLSCASCAIVSPLTIFWVGRRVFGSDTSRLVEKSLQEGGFGL